jgi:CBS domain-containing protein
MRVADILAKKGWKTFTVQPDASATELSTFLRERHIGAAVVSRDGRRIEGVVSERDLAYKLSNHGPQFGQLPVSAVMTGSVITCRPTDLVGMVASTMLAKNIRHLPVVDDGDQLIGMVSMRDVLSIRITQLQEEAAQLRATALDNHRDSPDRE